jgi:predicted sugar kinase
MIQLELTAPACLLLGMANVEGQACQLGVTLQYPPIQLAARSSDTLLITGGRADLAYQQAERFLQYNNLPRQGEVEIELAIPSFMGLGSAPMMGMSVAGTFATLNRLSVDDNPALARAAGLLADDETLEARAFTQGGLLLVDRHGQALRRFAIPPRGDEGDWVWVLVLPRVPADTPGTLEADRRVALHEASVQLAGETGQIATAELWPAAEHDDVAAFAQVLERIQTHNDDALDRSGRLPELSDADRQILAVMRENGALVCGRIPTGLGLYALIRGGGPSRSMRRALTDLLGIFGGTVMASICDNNGARLQITKETA